MFLSISKFYHLNLITILISNEQYAVFSVSNTLEHLRINCLDLGDKY